MNAPGKSLLRVLGTGALAAGIVLALNLPADASADLARQAAQRHRPNPAAAFRNMPAVGFGAPLARLDAADLGDFAAGMDEFTNVEDAEGGLGPIFNHRSCAACHSVPALGGSSALTVTRFGRRDQGHFNALDDLGGSLLQSDAIAPGARELVPTAANVVALRQSTPLFGLGLIEAIPDQAILAVAARQPAKGLHGLPSMVLDVASGEQRVGRFGWKAQQASLLSFAGDAYVNEMGITSRLFPNENAPNGDAARLAQYDHVADPEDSVDPATGKGDIDVAADFMRLLAPPPALPLGPSALRGATVFVQAACAGCHQPQMRTGANRIAALDRVPVNLYSDLLLHDMGALGDGIEQGTARGGEFKTPPLWGLRASGPYLHDGRAASVDAAIRAHDGEAARSREAYRRLTPAQRQQLLAFLASI